MGGSVNLANIVKSFMNPGYAGYVNSLNSLDGNIDLISSDESIIIDKTGGTAIDASGNAIDASGNRVLNLRVAPGAVAGVASVQGVSGAVLLSSPDGTINITDEGQTINVVVEGYSDVKQSIATLESNVGVLQGQYEANGVGDVGTSADTPSSSTSLWALSKKAYGLIPIQDFSSAVLAVPVAMTASFVDIRTMVLTTTLSSTPIMAWGSITIRETGGGSATATVEYLLRINGIAGDIHTAIVPHQGQLILPVFFLGAGSVSPGNTNIVLQARASAGACVRTASSVMAIGNPTPA